MKSVARIAVVLASLAAIAGVGRPTEPSPGQLAAMARLEASFAGSMRVEWQRQTGMPRFLRFGDGLPPRRLPGADPAMSAAARADRFLAENGSLWGLGDLPSRLARVGTTHGGLGIRHVVYQQTHRGVPVFAAVLKVHFSPEERIFAVNGTFLPGIASPVSARLGRTAAVDRALASARARFRGHGERIEAGLPTLWIFRAGLPDGRLDGADHLTWWVEVRDRVAGVHEQIFVDALDGTIVDVLPGSEEALQRQIYEESLSTLIWDETVADPNPIPPSWMGGSSKRVSEWQDEVDGAGEAYRFFSSMTSGAFLSYDGASAIMSSINNDLNVVCPNASWDGQTASFCSGTASDDFVGHEWAHAYTEFTNDLIYRWQSGALNEGYADIWGETIDFLNGRGTDVPDALRAPDTCSSNAAGANLPGGPVIDTVRWLIAEDASALGGVRDLWHPRCFGHPGKVSDWEYVCDSGDNGGVHANSGIPNHLFALLVDGGTYNSVTVPGIGLTKAAHVHWQAQNLLTPASAFVDQADALEAACTALIGLELPALSALVPTTGPSGAVIDGSDCDAVGAAIDAVELRLDPVQCGFQPLLDPGSPAACGGNASSLLVEDWEAGGGAWTVGARDVASPGTFDAAGWTIVGELPDDRAGSAMFVADDPALGDCDTDLETGVLFLQSPVVAMGQSESALVRFDHYVATEPQVDGGNLKIRVNGGAWVLVPPGAFNFNSYNSQLFAAGVIDNPLAGEAAFTGSDNGVNTGSWGTSQADLAAFVAAGDSFELRFEFGLDACDGVLGWYVDDIEIEFCSDCGNGLADPDEACDDANGVAGDGCTPQCEVEAGWECSDPVPAQLGPNVMADPGFEAGTPNPVWTEASVSYGTPICDVGCQPPGAQSGEAWVWFGREASDDASVSQEVVVPSTASQLLFALGAPQCDSAFDVVEVLVDGNLEYVFAGGPAPCGSSDYLQQAIDISGYADDGVHTITIRSETIGHNGGPSSFYVDDVYLPSHDGEPAVPSHCVDAIFADSFESGDTGAWTETAFPGVAVVRR